MDQTLTKTLDKFWEWLKEAKAKIALVIFMFAVAGGAYGQFNNFYGFVHKDDIVKLEGMIVASNRLNANQRELNSIGYYKDSINRQIFDLEKREDNLWLRHPLTDRDQATLKRIKRSLRKLENRLLELKLRERELKRSNDER